MPALVDKLSNHVRFARRMGPVSYARFFWQMARADDRRVLRPRFASLDRTLGVRTRSSDRHVLYQVLVAEEYAPLIGLDDVSLIVDCGANVGYTALYLLHHYPDARLVALECDPDNYELCKQNLAPVADRVELRREAIWPETTGLVVERDRDWSDFGVQVRLPNDGESPDVVAVSMSMLLSRIGAERIDLLKIDIEGAEKPLLSRNTAWLEKVDHLAIELHDDEARTLFDRAMEPFECDRIEHGELTICRNIRMKPQMDADAR